MLGEIAEDVEETHPRSLGAAAEQGELLSQRQVLKNEVGAGLQRSAQSAQQSEYEGHCYAGSLDRRPTSSVATDILTNHRMRFLHDKVAHHFGLTKTGGFLTARGDRSRRRRDRRRSAEAFQSHRGGLQAGRLRPANVHPWPRAPGVPLMKKLKSAINYEFQETPLRGRVAITTTNP